MADVTNGNIVHNDLRFTILDVFDAEGIEIPSAVRAEVPKAGERWPTDDEKDEAGLVDEKAREVGLAERKAGRKGRTRKPDPD